MNDKRVGVSDECEEFTWNQVHLIQLYVIVHFKKDCAREQNVCYG
jgi:hypothetical protein